MLVSSGNVYKLNDLGRMLRTDDFIEISVADVVPSACCTVNCKTPPEERRQLEYIMEDSQVQSMDATPTSAPVTASGGENVKFTVNFKKQNFEIDVSANQTLGDFRQKVYELSGVAPGLQKLMYKGNMIKHEIVWIYSQLVYVFNKNNSLFN